MGRVGDFQGNALIHFPHELGVQTKSKISCQKLVCISSKSHHANRM